MARRDVLFRFLRAAASGGAKHSASAASSSSSSSGSSMMAGARLRRVSELDPSLLSKARKLALGVGGAAGVFGSLVGVGGGVLIGPVILNACPAVPQRVISGTSLAAVAATGATAGWVYLSAGCVDTTAAAIIAATAVLTAPLGARMTHRFDCQRLRTLLGYFMFAAAPLVPAKALVFAERKQQQDEEAEQQESQPQQPGTAAAAAAAARLAARTAAIAPAPTPPAQQQPPQQQQQRPAPTPQQQAALAATGCLAGFASGLLGIGGGTIVTPLLALLLTNAPQQTVLGTSLVAMVVPALVGLSQHQKLGNVDWRMAAGLAAGTTVGSACGSSFALSAPPGVLEGLFAAGMALLGRRTLVAVRKAGVPKAAT